MKIAIVTGASSGMGREAVRQIDRIFDATLDEIWVIARRKQRLEELASHTGHKLRIMPLDLTDEKAMAELELSLNLLDPDVKLLVNASGYGVTGPFADGDAELQAGMIRLNCECLTKITHIVLPYIHKGGRIIQFASSAAFVPQPDFSVYAATKSYVLSFSRSLDMELKSRGISVTAVCPGPVNTEFFSIAEKNGSSFDFKKYFMADEKKVVRLAMYDAYKRHQKSVYSLPMKLFDGLMKIIPHSLVLKIMMLIKR